MPCNRNIVINSGHGLYFETAVATARVSDSKILLGIYGGWSWMDRAWNTSFNKTFAADYRGALNPEHRLEGFDSSLVFAFSKLLSRKGTDLIAPGCAMQSFHNYSLYYGLIFKLPGKTQPTIKIYTGFVRSHLLAAQVITDGDYNIFQLRRRMYGSEIIVFSGWKLKKSNSSTGLLSLYAECASIKNASLYFSDGSLQKEIKLKNFAGEQFLQKYQSAWTFGFRVSHILAP
jgi:hypothetical protein